MRFGREIDDNVRMLFLKETVHGLSVADIRFHKAEVLTVHDRRQCGQIPRVGQLVKTDDPVIRMRLHHMKNKVGTYKSGSSCHNNSHFRSFPTGSRPRQSCQQFYDAPSCFNTTATVFRRILMSSLQLQFRIYSVSRRTTSSKSVISLRPLTCHIPVIPGLTLIRTR